MPPGTRKLPVPGDQARPSQGVTIGEAQGSEPQHSGRGQACHELHEGAEQALAGNQRPLSLTSHGVVDSLSGNRPVSVQCSTNPVDRCRAGGAVQGLDADRKGRLEAATQLSIGPVLTAHRSRWRSVKEPLIQALSKHIQQTTALPDELREATIRGCRRLCTHCRCANEREQTRFLAFERRPRRCQIARLLRARGHATRHPDCRGGEAGNHLVCPT